MRRTHRLARFHMVSADGVHWFHAERLSEVFQPDLDPPSPLAGSPEAATSAAAWFYSMDGEVRGPISETALQALIDSGALGPHVRVRRSHESQWSRCDQVEGFRFGPPPAEPAARRRAGLPTSWIVGPVLGFTAAVLLLGGLIASQVGSRRPPIKVANPAPNESPGREAAANEAARNLGDSPPSQEPEPARKPGPIAKAQPRPEPEPEPEPDPATAPVKAVKLAAADLPRASTSAARHDSAQRNLAVALPAARRFALRLRGLDDAEIQQYHLVALPTEPGRADALTIIYRPAKLGEQELARFWIDGARLEFRWAAQLTRPLAEPAKALRDCVLEVRGGGILLNVVLRTPLVDPRELAVKDGVRAITAGGDWQPPVRKLIIRSGEVKIGGVWKDLPDQISPDCRQLTTSPPEVKADDAPIPPFDPLILSVLLIEQGTKLHSKLEPSHKRLTEQADRFKKETQRLQQQQRARTAEMDQAERTLQELPLRHRQATLQAAQRGEVFAPLPPLQELSAQIIERREALRNEIRALEDQVRQSRAREQAQHQLVGACDEYRSAPIRVRLGIIVDGDEVDVARIGP
jgi:hypothetical protein